MKKYSLLILAALSASVAGAATISCVPTNQNVITNASNVSPQSATCSGITASPGMTITGIAISIIGSFQDSVRNSNHQIQFTATNSFNGASVVGSTAVDDFTGNTGVVTGATVAVGGNPVSLPNITVTVNAATLGGLGLPDNASFSAFVVTTEAPQTGIPEPSTFGMVGATLTALGVYARRRKS